MGIRDAFKAKVKGVLGRVGATPAARPAGDSFPGPLHGSPGAEARRVESAGTPPAAAAPEPAAEVAWVRLAPSDRVREGKPGTFAQAGHTVAVFRLGGQLYGIDNACAHEDGPIGEGAVDGCTVRCPYHDWQYDFTTGACITNPERPRATWAIKESEGYLWLGAQLTAGSDSRGGDHDDGMEVIKR